MKAGLNACLAVLAVGSGTLILRAQSRPAAADDVARWEETAAVPAFVLQNRIARPEPFQHSRLQINPPTFRWPAVKGAKSYRLELSRSADFTPAEVQRVAVAFHRPLAPLATGRWYWRVRADDPAQPDWMGPESFAITDELPRWPVPEWASLLQRIPSERPRCFVASGDVARWRADAALQHRLAPRAAAIRSALEKPFKLEDYVARTRVAGDSEQQRAKRVEWESRGAARTAATPAGEAAWIWLATGDRWMADAAQARALLLASLDPQGFTSEANTDFGNADIVANLAFCYDILHDRFTADERARIRVALVARARPIFAKLGAASQDMMRPHNWQHVFLHGMTGALALYGDEPVAGEWLELGLKTFVAMYPWFGGNDGGSHEGTRYYHATEMLSSLDTLDFFAAAFGLRLDAGNPWFRRNVYFLMYSFPPNSRMAQLGDSNEGMEDDGDDRPFPGARAQATAHRMAELYHDGFAAAYAAAVPVRNDNRLTVSEILRWRSGGDMAPRPLQELPDVGLFRDIGAVFTHSAYTRPDENVRFVFHSSPYGGFGHGHADQNSFHVIAYNEPLLLDAGYYTPAGDPHRQKYSVQTMAHNTILVDGTGQPYGDTTGYGRITHFEDHPDWAYWVGSAATAYHDASLDRFDRHVVWLKRAETPTYVVVDDLAATGGTPHRYDWLLHAGNRMQIAEAENRVTVTGEKGTALVTFVHPAELTFTQTDQFPVPAVYWRQGRNFPLPNQWHVKATPPQAADARFFAVVQVAKRGGTLPPLQLRPEGVTVSGWTVDFAAAEHRLKITAP